MYGKVMMGIIRSTFIIDEEGNILVAWKKVKVKDHVDNVYSTLIWQVPRVSSDHMDLPQFQGFDESSMSCFYLAA